MIRKEFTIIASSTDIPTSQITDSGSRFNINLSNEPITIPHDAHNISVCVDSASLWWISPNIFDSKNGTQQNNLLYVQGPDVNDVIINSILEIPQGLYDVDTLSSALNLQLENAGFKINPDPIISLDADNATQKTILRFNYPQIAVDFTQPNTLRTILGFDSVVIFNGLVAPQNFISNNQAQFSTIDSFYICTDLISNGIRVNTRYSNAIANVPINVAVGYQILYNPFNPPTVPAPDLRGAKKNGYSIWITDQLFNPVNLVGYPTKVQMRIQYDIKD